jgi:hypothetical protein
MNDKTRSTGTPVVRALRIEAEALKRAAQMVEDADLIPRAELVAWLEREAEDRHHRGTEARLRNDQHNGPAFGVLEWCFTELAKDIKGGNPWEQR